MSPLASGAGSRLALAAGRRAAALAAGAAGLLAPAAAAAAAEALARALPEVAAGERRRLARRARARRAVALRDARVLARLGDVALCARLRLEDWERMPDAGERSELVYLVSPAGCPAAAARALAVYRSPLLAVAGAAAGGGARLSGGRRLTTPREVESWRAEGAPGAVLVGLDAPGPTLELALPGGALEVAALPFRLAAERPAPLVPISGRSCPGGWAVAVDRPLEPGDGGVEELAARYAGRLVAAIGASPADWPWLEPRWRPR